MSLKTATHLIRVIRGLSKREKPNPVNETIKTAIMYARRAQKARGAGEKQIALHKALYYMSQCIEYLGKVELKHEKKLR